MRQTRCDAFAAAAAGLVQAFATGPVAAAIEVVLAAGRATWTRSPPRSPPWRWRSRWCSVVLGEVVQLGAPVLAADLALACATGPALGAANAAAAIEVVLLAADRGPGWS